MVRVVAMVLVQTALIVYFQQLPRSVAVVVVAGRLATLMLIPVEQVVEPRSAAAQGLVLLTKAMTGVLVVLLVPSVVRAAALQVAVVGPMGVVLLVVQVVQVVHIQYQGQA